YVRGALWSRHSRRIVPISLSTYGFCHSDRGAIGLSRKPMARKRCLKIGPYAVSRSRIRHRGALSQGNASMIWREIHSAVGFVVTPNDTHTVDVRDAESQGNRAAGTLSSAARRGRLPRYHQHDWPERSASPAMAANPGTYSVRPSTARL